MRSKMGFGSFRSNWVAALVCGVLPFLTGFTTATLDPNDAEIVTSDVEHFWQAFDAAAKVPAAERLDIYRKRYFDSGSQGFKDYIAYRHVTPESFTQHVEDNRAYYDEIRPQIAKVVSQKPVIADAFRRMKALDPDIKFPKHVYFVVGPQKGAGMNSDNGIILAADMFATPPGTPYAYNKIYPGYVPFSVVHETVHFNQVYETGDSSTILQQTVNEGSADFIASLVIAQPEVRQNTDRWQYGCAHEAELDARFEKDRDSTQTSPWFFDHAPSTGWPPDMGYWLGYRVDQSYYAQAKDKRQALRDILQVTDFKAFLAASGYPQHKQPCAPEKPL